MNREDKYQCQGIAKTGLRCTKWATVFHNGKNFCSKHHWLAIAKKEKK